MSQITNPLVSVIMCVYNGEKYIWEAINSILVQSFSDFEFIIVNDGSTDNTDQIILSFIDDRIIYIKNDYNLKIIKSSNIAVNIARGKYIARMDADDISLPDRFEKQVKIFNHYPGIDIINGNVYFLTEDGKKYREQKSLTTTFGFESIRYLMHIQNFMYNPTVMVKSSLLKRYKYIDDISREHIEDYDVWVRMIKDGCICYTTEDRLVLYRDNSLSINHTHKKKQVERMFVLCSNLLKESFDFQIDKFSFEIILAEGGLVNYFILKRINTHLINYNSLIRTNYPISISGYIEMEIWRQQKMILIALKSFKHISFFAKVNVLLFLINHLNWFVSKSVRTLLKRSIFTKYWERQ